MVLRKLAIFGFKSFADKTEVEFGEGVTAVIGPNGCGKSNVIDAIRWVFGEQKPTALRSATMQDVIFSGSQKRRPLNFAEVTLTIENTKNILPSEYTEVAITRRIFRSGESEYLINKVPCRLRDIHTMFLDTGVGSTAYTTIENAMINSILSDKAEERRVLFEEAAGIGKYKERRKESLRQLDRTRQDLLRINDTVQEADRQVRMLARHVEKANRYRRYFNELKSLEVGFEHRRYTAYTGVLDARKKELDECDQRRQVARTRAASAEAAIEQAQLAALEQEKELEAAAKRVAEANEAIITLDRDMSVAKTNIVNLRENMARCDREQAGLDEQVEAANGLRMQLEKGIIEHVTELDACNEKVGRARGELVAFDGKVTLCREAADRAAAEQIEVINAIGEQKNAVTTLKTNHASGAERCEHDEKELAALQARLDEYREAVELCRRQLESAAVSHKNLSASRESLLARIEKEDVQYQALVGSEKKLEAQIDACKSQRAFLEGLDASFEGYESGVKAVLTGNLPGVAGIVADLVRVPDESLLKLVERVLGPAIQTLVFSTDADLKNAIDFLTREQAGSARMVSIERLRRRQAVSATALPGAEPLRGYVQTSDGHACVADFLFGNAFVTATAGEALSCANENAGAVFASRDGVVCLENGCVLAGAPKKQQPGILQRKQQIEKCIADIERFEKEYQRVIHDKEICIINRDEAKFALVEVDEKLNTGRRQQQEQETTIMHHENESRAVEASMQELRLEIGRTRERMVEIDAQIKTAELRCEELVMQRQGVENRVELSRAALAEMQQQRIAMADHLKNIELETMGLTARINQERQDVERLVQNVKHFTATKEKTAQEKQQAAADAAALESSLAGQQQQLEQQTARRAGLERERAAQRDKLSAMQIGIEEQRKALKADQAEAEELSNKFHGLELDQARDEQEKRRIRERMFEVYKVDLESPPEDLLRVEEEEAVVVERINTFKERLRRLGDVNMAALTDFEAESARLREMTAQRDDLQTAVDDLEKAIKKLDKEARVQFVATFEQVQKNFITMFTTLFEGGEAHLSLEENADPLEAAIAINVRPAGKKMRGIALLSGGERALTAISLLFSLYLVKPSAYCILDELDAPLDDANIGRFVSILKKFSEQTQFIVVTHNKRTMEAADLLYGVTQQEHGVSTIVGVKFEDVALKAA
ncbi:MAG TPA: chromosome segregation protein SMC [Chitinivibrionales bacterium]|nr:chromosome segregation protein SMC [Chitinivibrionales bacterium]